MSVCILSKKDFLTDTSVKTLTFLDFILISMRQGNFTFYEALLLERASVR